MKVNIDKEKCIGCGACISLCPNVFELGEDDKPQLKVSECDDECCKDAKDSCPVEAISVEE